MEQSNTPITLPSNIPELVEKAKSRVNARKAEIASNREDLQNTIIQAQVQAEQAKQRLRELIAQETAAKREAEELAMREEAIAAERRVKRLAERKARELVEKRKIEAAETLRRTQEKGWRGHIEPPLDQSTNIEVNEEQIQAIKELAKQRGDTLTFDSDAEGENMDTISPFSLMAISPQGACEQYQKVRLNTIRNMMCAINRRLSKSVATEEKIIIKERNVRPNADIDTLCLFTDEMREDVAALYRQKGWDVEIIDYHNLKVRYVFKPQPIKE